MKSSILKFSLGSLALIFVALPVPLVAADPISANDQSNSADRIETTRKIRQSLVNDESLSVAAQNVTVVTTDDGIVTLKGSVKSKEEKETVSKIARSVAGAARVNDELIIGIN